jgi:hypothetical protein
MQNLQIQDTFQPYYADTTLRNEEIRIESPAAKPSLSSAEIRARLEACRSRLARAIAATEAGRH